MKFGFGSPLEKNGVPRIDRIAPAAAIPGGEIVIYGSGFASRTGARPVVHFGEADASLMLATDNRVIARVPDSANGGTVRVANANGESQPHPVSIGIANRRQPASGGQSGGGRRGKYLCDVQRAAGAARSGFAV